MQAARKSLISTLVCIGLAMGFIPIAVASLLMQRNLFIDLIDRIDTTWACMDESGAVAVRFEDPITGASIERTSRLDDVPRYAIRLNGRCLGKSGEWTDEPIPSERDDAFLNEHRWDGFLEAEAAMKSAQPDR